MHNKVHWERLAKNPLPHMSLIRCWFSPSMVSQNVNLNSTSPFFRYSYLASLSLYLFFTHLRECNLRSLPFLIGTFLNRIDLSKDLRMIISPYINLLYSYMTWEATLHLTEGIVSFHLILMSPFKGVFYFVAQIIKHNLFIFCMIKYEMSFGYFVQTHI